MKTSFLNLKHLPIGFTFRPTDEQLVDHYLKNKLLGNDSIVNNVIAEVDVCKFEPWELPGCSVIKNDDPEWFFLCPRDYKYAKSTRYNRATKCGFWKATGNDRKVRIRGSDKVIGIKKTLVYYKGRVPAGVKTNWVIHEYHATTFDDSQRTFVLCRLMKKAGKNGEEETDTMIFDGGEPSRQMSSDYENQETVQGIPDVSDTFQEMNMESIFQAPHQAGNYFPFSTQHSSISENENEVSFPNSQSDNAYFGNVNLTTESPFETPEEEDKFINSMFTDEDFVTSEKRRAYYESSDTDAEVVSALCGNMLDSPTMYLEHLSSGEYYASRMFKSTHSTAYGSTCLLSFNNDEIKDKRDYAYEDDFWGVEASSCDSTADKPMENNYIEILSSSTLKRNRNQYHQRPTIFMSQRTASK